MKLKYLIAAAVVLFQMVGAADAQASSRATKKIGLGIGLVTNPFPSLLGFSASYNLHKQVRLTAAYGTVSDTALGIDVKTFEVAAKVFFVDWNFAPFGAIGYSNISGSMGAGNSTIKATGSALDYGFGLDWQTYLGFNLGLEYKMISVSGQSTGLPGAYIGWYF